MDSIRLAVSSLFEPLDRWSASIIRTREEHDNLHYAIARSLVRIAAAILEADISELSRLQQDYITTCISRAKAYIIQADNKALHGEDDSCYDDSDGREDEDEEFEHSTYTAFRRLLREKCSVDLFVTSSNA